MNLVAYVMLSVLLVVFLKAYSKQVIKHIEESLIMEGKAHLAFIPYMGTRGGKYEVRPGEDFNHRKSMPVPVEELEKEQEEYLMSMKVRFTMYFGVPALAAYASMMFIGEQLGIFGKGMTVAEFFNKIIG